MPNIEELIQRAIQEGKFNDLPGKGQPLHLDKNPHADPDWQLAYHLLKENGFSLPWLELRQEIESEIEATRQAFKLAWEWRQTIPEPQAGFERALRVFAEKVAHINQRIFDYNLQTPMDRFQMRKLDLQQEIERICQSNSIDHNPAP